MRFDFRNGVAILQDHVDVVRDLPGGVDDRLRCDRLMVYFRPPPSSEKDPSETGAAESAEPTEETPNGEGTGKSMPKLTVSRIEARGAEVVLQAPSVQVAARGELLQYDFQTRRIVLKDRANAFLAYQQHVTEAPRLEYELHEDSKRLGRLWATGPGVYRGALGKEKKATSSDLEWDTRAAATGEPARPVRCGRRGCPIRCHGKLLRR